MGTGLPDSGMDFDAALQAYYRRDLERDRLASGIGRLEFLRTIEVISRSLPEAPSVVADIGGGPGRYTDWLVGLGHHVIHRDIVEHHVDAVRQTHGAAVDTAVGDARQLDLGDASADAVLLLGPLYHLPDPDDRWHVLAEARRILRPGGTVYAAAISRWAPRIHGIMVDRVHVEYPAVLDLIDELERVGAMHPVTEGGFNGYAHTPDGLRTEVGSSGLDLESLISIEGPAVALADIDARLDDPGERALLFDTLRSIEAVPDILGVGPHLLAIARRV